MKLKLQREIRANRLRAGWPNQRFGISATYKKPTMIRAGEEIEVERFWMGHRTRFRWNNESYLVNSIDIVAAEPAERKAVEAARKKSG